MSDHKKYSFDFSGNGIIAEIDIPQHGVKKGDRGGALLDGSTLSHKGNCWVAEGCTIKKTHVEGDAWVASSSPIFGSWIRDQAVVIGQATINESRIEEKAEVFGNAIINKSVVGGSARVFGKAIVQGNSVVNGQAIICDNALVESCEIKHDSHIFGKAILKDCYAIGSTRITRPLEIPRTEKIMTLDDYVQKHAENGAVVPVSNWNPMTAFNPSFFDNILIYSNDNSAFFHRLNKFVDHPNAKSYFDFCCNSGVDGFVKLGGYVRKDQSGNPIYISDISFFMNRMDAIENMASPDLRTAAEERRGFDYIHLSLKRFITPIIQKKKELDQNLGRSTMDQMRGLPDIKFAPPKMDLSDTNSGLEGLDDDT